MPDLGGVIAPQPSNMARAIYTHRSTNNKSFIDMHHFLKATGIKNNEFFLALLDPDLAYIDPHDPNLNFFYKQKVLREVMSNYWYWLRECLRLPSPGGAPVKFGLHRANLAFNFCSMLNINAYMECPRQLGKTISVLCRLLYIYTYGTTNSKMALLNKSMEASRSNLQIMKDIRDMLPPYLQLKERPMPNGKYDRGKDNTTQIVNPFNNNSVTAYAAATNESKAASLLRGKTLPIIYFDELGFIPHVDAEYLNGMPAHHTAAANAERTGAPHQVIVTTTSAFMNTNEGKFAYDMKEQATPFNEAFYDLTQAQLREILNANRRSDFVYVKYSYQELGMSEEWFDSLCKLLKNDWPTIRREILLEWNTGVSNSPFNPDDLETIRTMVKPPISVVYLLGKYRFETYLQADTKFNPPIMGVDVSAGYKQDSSTITIIDSKTTKVLGCLNCNYISATDLARCIEFIVRNWLPNAVINVERNGGYGAAVISNLIRAGLRKNLYYEIKDVVQEERMDGVHTYKQKIRTKVFGLNSTREVRKQLIDLLAERVQYHKDKFISPIIYNELIGMEVKRNGKIEHSDSTHDDQIFSYLMAMYVWYNGTNLTERYGIHKTSIKTDEDIDEQIDFFEPETMSIVDQLGTTSPEIDQITEQTLRMMNALPAQSMKDYVDQQHNEEMRQFYDIVGTKLGEKAYREKYNIPEGTDISKIFTNQQEAFADIPESVFMNFYEPNAPEMEYIDEDTPAARANAMAVPEGMATSLNDENYRYIDHFNF